MSVKEKMTAIADAIRAKTGDTGKLDLDAMAAAVPQVYEAGYAAGEESQAGQYEAGYAAGKQTEYDRFWDAFQNYGTRTFYDQTFSSDSGSWDDESYDPKYDILCEGVDSARQTFGSNRKLTSTKVPIRCNNTRLVYTFCYCTKLKTIPLLTLEGITQISNAFIQCSALENITIEGEIPLSISFEHSTKLTQASIISIINALSDTVTGQTLTLSETAVNTAFGDENILGMDTAEWGELCDSKPNWTITLM